MEVEPPIKGPHKWVFIGVCHLFLQRSAQGPRSYAPASCLQLGSLVGGFNQFEKY